MTLAAGGVAAVGLMAARHEPVIRPDVRIGIVEVGGATRDEAARKLRVWWDSARRRTVVLSSPNLTASLPPATLTGLGVRLDDASSVAPAPLEGFWEGIGRRIGISQTEPVRLEPVLTFDEAATPRWTREVALRAAAPRPARVRFIDGTVVREPESSTVALDVAAFPEFALGVARGGEPTDVPLTEAPKRVPDAALAQIREVVATYTTRFNAGQRDRNQNIRLASGFLDGRILMPGERLSFNDVVGERTPRRGFRMAGVYRNGRHDFDFGGGICQVSTTLYNAALLADLGVVKRANHSMPVPYVPLGRDAAVSYGVLDLVLENGGDSPVAFTRTVVGNRITFHVLGQKTPGKEVRVVAGRAEHLGRPEKVVVDPNLPPGKTRVVDKGGARSRLSTTRVVLQDGVEVRREPLGISYYRGGTRIVAVSPADAPAGAPHVSTVALPRP